MLTAGADRPGRTTGEVCSHRCKTGWNRAVEAGHGGRGGDFAAAETITAPFRLPAGLGLGYSARHGGLIGHPSGKCRLKSVAVVSRRERLCPASGVARTCFLVMVDSRGVPPCDNVMPFAGHIKGSRLIPGESRARERYPRQYGPFMPVATVEGHEGTVLATSLKLMHLSGIRSRVRHDHLGSALCGVNGGPILAAVSTAAKPRFRRVFARRPVRSGTGERPRWGWRAACGRLDIH